MTEKGMDPDDVILSLEPHATSKIRNEKDISNIITMGFRGEALPSISSISKLRIRSRKREMMEGAEVVVNGGRFVSEGPVGCAPGTEVRIADIFFNIPARKKFLKSYATEEKHIYETFCLLALSNPNITFELIIDGRTAVVTPSGDSILPRIGKFLGKSVIDLFLPVEHENGTVKVSGYVSKPGFVRNNRRDQRVFINGRPIRTNVAYSAIKEAYNTMVMKGSYPVVVLYIDMNPQDVDINVHPAKHEARFKNERMIGTEIKEAISQVLRESIRPAPAVSTQNMSIKSIMHGAEIGYIEKEEIKQPELDLFSEPDPVIDIVAPKVNKDFTKERIEEVESKTVISSRVIDETLVKKYEKNNEAIDTIVSYKPQNIDPKIISLPGSGNIEIVGNLDATYFLAKADSGLLIIDQHAAHERIWFEKLFKRRSEFCCFSKTFASYYHKSI